MMVLVPIVSETANLLGRSTTTLCSTSVALVTTRLRVPLSSSMAAIALLLYRYNHLRKAAQKYVDLPNKVLTFIGGVEAATGLYGRKQYIKAPILAICMQDQHDGVGSAAVGRELIIDLHTSECPIEITAHNASVTLADAGMEDFAVSGTLTVYVVQRWTITAEELLQGKAGIFQKSAAWEHADGQSDRGISNLLSSLRVFADLTSGMEEAREDAVLHMLYLLTRFPPAVRAAYILMRGETLRYPERAALSQCLMRCSRLSYYCELLI